MLKKTLQWLRSALGDLVFLSVLLWLLFKIAGLVLRQSPNLTEWLLVYLTAVYALVTFYLAAMSAKSAVAAERSAKAMEASIEEARLSRWAQFAATIRLARGDSYIVNKGGSVTLELLNVFEQPVLDLMVSIWKTEKGPSGESEVKYSTMIASQPVSLLAEQKKVVLSLTPSSFPESQRRIIGDIALERFKQVFNKRPEYSLCLLTYYDRATPSTPMLFVYDLRPDQEDDRVH